MSFRHLILRGLCALAMAVSGPLLAADITVSAASSLTNAFTEVVREYRQRYPDTQVWLNFGGSGALLQQLDKGAPVDVFASADQETMDSAGQRQLVVAAERRDFARNALVLITPTAAPIELNRLEDLLGTEIQRIAVGNPASVPVGRYTRRALESAELWSALSGKVIQTENVRQALSYVASGEVDAGFVYATDAAVMRDRVQIVMRVPLDVDIRYPIATTATAAQPEEARRFIGFVLSPQGQAILTRHGFDDPTHTNRP